MKTVSTISMNFDNLRSVFASIGFFDILDIVVVALILYAILIRLRSTSALRIASAIVILLIATALTNTAKMRVLNFLLSKILEIGLIAVVIVFQPELRRVLEHFGSRSLMVLTNQSSEDPREQVIDQVVHACDIMSRERTGVLLVFEREIALNGFFKSGTLIDAEVSSELLRNLFFTKAALHDGAVIICGNRIAAAGCVLPLTESTSISSDLGTRHRAGIGMSEATDAVVVIVSEETGTISVAVGGMLKRSLTPETLKMLLTAELANGKSESTGTGLLAFARRLLKKNAEKEAEHDEESK